MKHKFGNCIIGWHNDRCNGFRTSARFCTVVLSFRCLSYTSLAQITLNHRITMFTAYITSPVLLSSGTRNVVNPTNIGFSSALFSLFEKRAVTLSAPICYPISPSSKASLSLATRCCQYGKDGLGIPHQSLAWGRWVNFKEHFLLPF